MGVCRHFGWSSAGGCPFNSAAAAHPHLGRGEPIAYQDVARGVALPDSTTAVLDDVAPLERLPLATTHVIEELGFVSADAVDPISYQRAYYARPNGASAERPYESSSQRWPGPDSWGWPRRPSPRASGWPCSVPGTGC
ncbi:hypothetical protein ACFWBS_41100 [Streptomyces mirabilis]|uniref:hypothetical protein n=1 Tax=Streptomyces mirabilis TaxID=68239 RepID=UPI00365254B8